MCHVTSTTIIRRNYFIILCNYIDAISVMKNECKVQLTNILFLKECKIPCILTSVYGSFLTYYDFDFSNLTFTL